MRQRGQEPLIVATLAIVAVVAVACSEPTATPRPGGTVSLISPENGTLFAQNDPTTGCTAHAKRGYGFRLTFDWDDVEGADRYFIRLKRTGAIYAAIDHSVEESSFDGLFCNTFVIDANLTNWVWRVAAVAHGADSTSADTLWSEERTYGFQPCRHPDGVPCSAPPDTTIPPA